MNKTPKLFMLAGAVLASLFLFVSIVYNNFIVAFRAKCKMFSRHLQKPILKTEKGRFKGL